MQDRQEKVQSILNRRSRNNAVVLPGFCVDAFTRHASVAIASALPGLNGEGPVLKGGALLASFMRESFPDHFGHVHPADYDFTASVSNIIPFSNRGLDGVIESLAKTGFVPETSPEKLNGRGPLEQLSYQNRLVITLKLSFESSLVDLVLIDRPPYDAAQIAAEGDTSISSVAMSSDGTVYADPNFVQDAKSGTYRILAGDEADIRYTAGARYERINKRYPSHFRTVMHSI